MIGATWDDKAINDKGVDQNTRSQRIIRDLARRRDLHIESYNFAAKAVMNLRKLGTVEDVPPLPPMSVKDTYRKRPESRRPPGDSRHEDGPIWRGNDVHSLVVDESREATGSEAGEAALTSQSRRSHREPDTTSLP